MAVKDVNGGNTPGPVSLAPVRVLTVNTLPGLQTSEQPADSVTVSSDARPSVAQQQVRTRINRAIEATNVAASGVEEIGKILGGIEGIVEQVTSGDLPAPRIAILQKEANTLQQELVKATNVSTSDGIKPLAGDPIRLELEETLGKALEILLPDRSKDTFGLGSVGLSPKDVILNTVAKIEEARRGIEQLRSQLNDGSLALRSTVAAVEVASQNLEASQTTVRDVDDALDLARGTKGEIREDPKGAIGSVGDIAQNATVLLRN